MSIDLLWLPDVSTTAVRAIDGILECEAILEASGPKPCSVPHCTGETAFRCAGSEKLHDAPIRGRGVRISLKYQQFQCNACGTRVPIPFQAGSLKMTKRCISYIRRQSLSGPASAIASTLSASTSTVERVCSDYKRYLKDRYRSYIPVKLGIDEVKVRGKFRYIIIDHEKNEIVDLLNDHHSKTLANWLNSVPGRTRVELVTMDQTDRYRHIFKVNCPNAKIACDKFHLCRRANLAVSATYQEAYGKKKLSRQQIGYNRSLLWSYRDDLDKQRTFELDGLLSAYPMLKEAYEFKNRFLELVNTVHEDPLQAYRVWLSTAPNISHFTEFLRSCENWRPQVITMINTRETNSTTEGLNKKVKGVANWSSNSDFEQIRIKVIYNIPSLPKNTCICCRGAIALNPVEPVSIPFDGADEQIHCPKCVLILDNHLRITTVKRPAA